MSKQSIVMAVVIVIFVGVITGYIIYKNVTNSKVEEPTDEVSVLLKDIKNSIGLNFGETTETEFSWMVEKDGTIQEMSVTGKQMEVKEVQGSEFSKVTNFFDEPDLYNIASGTVSELIGCKRGEVVCVVVTQLCSESTCVTKEEIEDNIINITVKCGYLNLDLDPISSEGLIEPKEIKVSKDNEFIIKLEVNLSTGFQWKPDFDYNYLEMTGVEYEAANTDLVGASGIEIFTLKPLQSGTTQLNFNYLRPWEDKAPIKKAVYNITIEE